MEYTLYGIGLRTCDIKNATAEGLKELICMAPSVKGDLIPYFEDVLEDCEDDVAETANELADGWRNSAGFASILAAVISELEDINLLDATDSNSCEDFLIFHEKFPWEYSEKERSLTDQDVIAIILKYVRVLTDEDVSIGYTTVYQEESDW